MLVATRLQVSLRQYQDRCCCSCYYKSKSTKRYNLIVSKVQEEAEELIRLVQYLVSDFDDITDEDVLDYMVENDVRNPVEALKRMIKN